MSDLIRREDAIDALKRAEAITKAFGYHNVIETIRELPSAQPKQRWIDGDKLMMMLADWWYSSFRETETDEAKAIRGVMDQVEDYIKSLPTPHQEEGEQG